ncbi:MAG: FtsK/SpoIIIE domain-containing protein [Phycisphaerales bacterium]
MDPTPPEHAPTPLELERAIVERLVAASAQRAAGEREQEKHAARERHLNERMHTSAREALAAAHEHQLEGIRARHAAEIDAIEARARERAEKVKADERTLRKDAQDRAEKAEEEAQRAYDEKVWMAESVYEAAVPALRKAVRKRIDELAARRQQVEALIESGHAAVRGYRQRTLRSPPAAAAEESALEELFRELESQLRSLRACRAAGLFRGPILVIPLLVCLVLGALGGYSARGSVGMGEGAAVAVGIVLGVLFFAVSVGVLYGVARQEVKRTYLPFLKAGARALGAIERAQAAAERERKEKEEAAARARDADLAAADARYKPAMASIEAKLTEILANIDAKAPHYAAKVMKQRAAEMDAAEATLARETEEAARRRAQAEAEEDARYADVIAEAQARDAAATQAREQAWRRAQEEVLAGIASLDQIDRACTVAWSDPSWQRWEPPTTALPAVRVGTLALRLSSVPDAVPTAPALAWPGDAATRTHGLPAFLDVPGRMSLVVETPPDGRDAGLRILQNAVARILVAVPPGKARFTFVDPVGLGQSFAGFMHLADEMESLVTDRIWTDARHIEQRLADLTEHMETVIQKYLRNEYATIEEYNAQAGEIAEPYRILVMADFPTNVSEMAAKRFASILQSGARCGVHVLLLRDLRVPLPPGLDASDLRRGATVLGWTAAPDAAGAFVLEGGALSGLPFAADPPPDDSFLQRITRVVGRTAKETSRVEVPFQTVAPEPAQRWTLSTARSFRVPLGRSGANRLQYMVLGGGTSQHALIAGKTGSGKSSLLNALIVSTALWYSPDEVEFWLVDFKKGVEFKAYATAGLPHARAVAVESDREFGLSVLQGLDDELRRRGELFRAAGVQNLADWRALGRPERMPRCLLVIDEFQELFIEDDKVAQDASLLLDRLVRQGRAFGMHVILGSQTLGGAYSIARSTMGQMGVRIALQCTETDSQLILSDDNTAARLLSRPGEAIYNDAGGLIEGNSPFQVVWIGDEEREAQLREVSATAAALPSAPRPAPIVFEGNQPADARANGPLLEALSAAEPGRAAYAPKLWFGDAVSIKEPTHAALVRRSGSNVAIVGQRDESATALLAMAMVALAAQTPVAGTRIVVLDGTTPDDRLYGALAKVAAALPHRVELPAFRDVPETLAALGAELAARSGSGSADAPGIFLLVNGVHRYRALRRNEDDYSYGGGGDAPPTPDKVLALLLKEGPLVGMHTILWADTVASLQRSVDRNALRELEHKVLFQLGANDSSALIDSPAASRLGFHRALLSNDETGLLEKFRPYALPEEGFLAKVQQLLRGRA